MMFLSTEKNCPKCGYPGSDYKGIYVDGKKCAKCGYVNIQDKLQLAFEYLDVTGIRKLFEAQMEEILFKITCEEPPEYANNIQKLKDILSWDNIAPVLAETIVVEFPVEILHGIIELYKTEPGIYMRDHLLELTEKLQANMTSFLEEKLKEIE